MSKAFQIRCLLYQGVRLMSAGLLLRPMVSTTSATFCRPFASSPGPFRAIIMGPPGGGKGTIATRVVRDYNVVHIASGDILRNHILNRTETGLEAKKYIDQGGLVPDELMVRLICKEVESAGHRWLLDGFPRTLSQAQALNEAQEVDIVVYLNVPFEEIVRRVKDRWIHPASGRVYNLEWSPPKEKGKDDITGEPLIQREDDKPETVMARLQEYEKQTTPVLEFYRKQNKLAKFSGTESNVIWPEVKKFLSGKF